MRVAHFVQRYPPALGGSEAYFARLGRWLAAAGDEVTVFTSNAVDLEALWSPPGRRLPAGVTREDGVEVRRYGVWRMPGRRWLLKPLSLWPHRTWQALTMTCNPISRRMWADAGRGGERFDVVHATAFPYAFPIACARRLARRLGVPFVLTPFLHLGDPDDPPDRTRRAFTRPALMELARSADRLFVQTEGERLAFLERGVPAGAAGVAGHGAGPGIVYGRRPASACGRSGASARDDVVIGHLANNSREKGTVDLLLAAERAWRQGGRFHVVLAGPEMPNFQRFWPSYGPAGRVRRLGVLDDEAEARLLRRPGRVRAAEPMGLFRDRVTRSLGERGAERRLPGRRPRVGDPARTGRVAGEVRRRGRIGGGAAAAGGRRGAAPAAGRGGARADAEGV